MIVPPPSVHSRALSRLHCPVRCLPSCCRVSDILLFPVCLLSVMFLFLCSCCLWSFIPVFHVVSVLLMLSLYPSRKRRDLDLSSSRYLVNPGRLSPSCSNQDPFSPVCVFMYLFACLSAVVVGGMLSGGSCGQWLCM